MSTKLIRNVKAKKILASFACLALAVLTACQAAPVTPTPTLPRPPQAQIFAPSTPVTLVPPATPAPLPTLAATPTAIPVALDKWQTFKTPELEFSFRFPPDWGGRAYTQALTRTLQPLSVDTIMLRGPGGNAAPEFVLMYNWPSLDLTQPLTNTTAWSSVAGLAKLFLYSTCTTAFDAPAPVTLAGEQTTGVKFVVQCDRVYAGYLVGLVHRGRNYGLLADVPQEEWDAWRPTFETMFASFTFNP